MSFQAFATLLRERKYEALEIGSLLLEIDVTDVHAVDVERLVSAIENRDGDRVQHHDEEDPS
jgi:hypothetical protein